MSRDQMRLELVRWEDAWSGLGCPEPEGVLPELISSYSEPHRRYHTLRHVAECFTALEPAAGIAERLPEVQIALWFHDSVFDTHRRDNEERSAEWAKQSLRDAGVNEETVSRVGALILATRHDSNPDDPDARLVADVDLAILGAPPERFLEYEQQVRREYSWLPEAAFRSGRAKLLVRILRRDSIYGTRWFMDRLETGARANVSDSLRRLTENRQQLRTAD